MCICVCVHVYPSIYTYPWIQRYVFIMALNGVKSSMFYNIDITTFLSFYTTHENNCILN